MSDQQGEWGMCAAFGCPLFGSVGSEGRWYCFCHAGRQSSVNDAITARLRGEERAVVEVTKAIRRDSLCGEQSGEMAAAMRDLKAHALASQLAFNRNVDTCARAWLQRLERHLIEATSDLGQQQLPANLTPTAPVIGPTHAMQHYTETD